MNAGAKLFSSLMLVLLAGCSPASDNRTGAVTQDQAGAAIVPAQTPARILKEPAPNPPSQAERRPKKAQAVEAPGLTETADDETPFIVTLPSLPDVPPRAFVPDLPPSPDAADPHPFPEEVTRYMVDRDGCDHFRSEEAYDEERRVYLEESVAELCAGTDARLAMLRERYADDPAVTAALGNYEDRIEGNASK